MTAYPCCECCLTDTMHPDQHEVACPTCDNPVADRLRAERGELADKLAHMREARDNARAEVERLTALIAEVRDAMEDESNLDGWVGNYVRTSTIRRILDGADSEPHSI